MHTANQSVLFAFSQTVDRIAGKTELQVTRRRDRLRRGRARARAGRRRRSASRCRSSKRSSTRTSKAQGNLLVLGIDMTGDRSLRDYDLESGDEAVIDDPLVFLAQPDSIILTKEFADAESAGDRQPPAARHGRGREAVHRPRHHEVVRADERLRRQPRDHGHLRRAEDVRPRPHVRSHRPRACKPGAHDRRGRAGARRAARARVSGRAAVRPRPAVRGDARRRTR